MDTAADKRRNAAQLQKNIWRAAFDFYERRMTAPPCPGWWDESVRQMEAAVDRLGHDLFAIDLLVAVHAELERKRGDCS